MRHAYEYIDSVTLKMFLCASALAVVFVYCTTHSGLRKWKSKKQTNWNTTKKHGFECGERLFHSHMRCMQDCRVLSRGFDAITIYLYIEALFETFFFHSLSIYMHSKQVYKRYLQRLRCLYCVLYMHAIDDAVCREAKNASYSFVCCDVIDFVCLLSTFFAFVCVCFCGLKINWKAMAYDRMTECGDKLFVKSKYTCTQALNALCQGVTHLFSMYLWTFFVDFFFRFVYLIFYILLLATSLGLVAINCRIIFRHVVVEHVYVCCLYWLHNTMLRKIHKNQQMLCIFCQRRYTQWASLSMLQFGLRTCCWTNTCIYNKSYFIHLFCFKYISVNLFAAKIENTEHFCY